MKCKIFHGPINKDKYSRPDYENEINTFLKENEGKVEITNVFLSENKIKDHSNLTVVIFFENL